MGHDVTWHANGEVSMTIGGEKIVLRRPTIGELEQLGDDWWRRWETIAGKSEKEKRDRHGLDVLTACAEWLLVVIATLAGKDGLTVTDLPAWAGNPQLRADLERFWLRVPMSPFPGDD